MKKRLITLFLFISSISFCQDNFQIEAYSVANEEDVIFTDIVEFADDKILFSGHLKIDGTFQSVIGFLASNGDIIDSYLLNVDDFSFESSDLYVRDGSEINVSSFDLKGEYYVTYEDNLGCQQEEFFSIKQQTSPNVSLTKDSISCLGESYNITFSGENIDSYYWNDGNTQSSRLITEDGQYVIFVENECGTNTAEHSATFKNCSKKSYFPTVFTPNNDGINDYFEAFIFQQSIGNCEIYDR